VKGTEKKATVSVPGAETASAETPVTPPPAQASALEPTKEVVKKKVKKVVKKAPAGVAPAAQKSKPTAKKTAAKQHPAKVKPQQKTTQPKPTAKKPAAKQQPAQAKPAAKKPAAKKPAAKKPAAKKPAAQQAPTPQPGPDGRLDVDATIRSRAKTVKAAELARRHKNVQVLGMDTIRGLIRDAVAEAAEQFENSLGAEEKKRLLEEAEETFQERLQSFKAEKAGLEAHAKNLQSQLDRAQSLLDEERQRIVSANQFTVSDAGMIEIEQRLTRMLDRAIAKGGVSAELEAEMREVLAKLLDDEREKISEKAQEAQNDRVELLERKIARLASSLDETTKERDYAKRRAQFLEESGGGGLQNVITGGIFGHDSDKERKLELMKEIFKANKEMYAELEKRGTRPEARKRPNVPTPKAESAESSDTAEATSENTTDEASLTVGRQPADEDTSIIDNAQRVLDQDGESEPEGVEEDAESGEEEIDPDDLPWEPPANDVVSKEVEVSSSSGVQSISVKQFAPPALDRRKGKEKDSTEGNG